MLLLCLYVGYLVWGYVHPGILLGWAAALLGGIIGRSSYLIVHRAKVKQQPQAWAGRLVAFALVSGIIAGSAAPLMPLTRAKATSRPAQACGCRSEEHT